MTDENCETKMAAVTGSSRMIPVEEALKMVLNASHQLPLIKASTHDALGKILAEGVKAFDPLPPYPASIKDGYAVVASNGPGDYPMITESRAGNDAVGLTVNSGAIAYVTTGGPVPEGANAVVQVEDTQLIENSSCESRRVRILKQTTPRVDIHPVV